MLLNAFFALIICSTCFGHLYAHHQELETILVLLQHMVCNALVAGGRLLGAQQQALCQGWGKLCDWVAGHWRTQTEMSRWAHNLNVAFLSRNMSYEWQNSFLLMSHVSWRRNTEWSRTTSWKICTEIPLSEVKASFASFKIQHRKPEHFYVTSKGVS